MGAKQGVGYEIRACDNPDHALLILRGLLEDAHTYFKPRKRTEFEEQNTWAQFIGYLCMFESQMNGIGRKDLGDQVREMVIGAAELDVPTAGTFRDLFTMLSAAERAHSDSGKK